MDILLEVDGRPAVIIENKVDSGVRGHAAMGPTPGSSEGEEAPVVIPGSQLATYGRWLAARVRPELWSGALLMIARGTRPPADFREKGENGYGVAYRGYGTWQQVANFLRKRTAAKVASVDDRPWTALARDFVLFLEEQQMATDTITTTDLALAQAYVDSGGRMKGTFDQAWNSVRDLRRENFTQTAPTPPEYNSEGRVIWSWCYFNRAAAAENGLWYFAFGFRFPDQSTWWPDGAFPDQPHIFATIGAEKDDLPVDRLVATPAPWSGIESELVATKPIHEMSTNPADFAEELAEWLRDRVSEAGAVVRELSGLSSSQPKED